MTTRLLFDTSVYITVLRDETFAKEFRPRYLRDIPRTHFSFVGWALPTFSFGWPRVTFCRGNPLWLP